MIPTLIVYQKLKHSTGCSFPLNPGVIKSVVADWPPLASSDPEIAKIASSDPA